MVHDLNSGHSLIVWRVIEMRVGDKQIIVSASDDTMICLWKMKTGQRLRILKGHTSNVRGLVEMADGTVLTGSHDKTITEYEIVKHDEDVLVGSAHKCNMKYDHEICCMKVLSNGSIVTGGRQGDIQVRRTWLSDAESLLVMCCKVIAKNQTKFDMMALEQNLPGELCELIINYLPE
eukprot:TRINITY_DN13432_c0_g1_i1.p1 TRINITY_DN13432_c0_g1~~TRINITY_DN13432_c0_g1_i1.p1  ORF type:complete len:188 (+),score=18.56 TRINITY_DN13432_c0_g1_i1:35-565(+)